MVSIGLYILETIAAVETVFRLSQQYALMHDNNVTVVPVEEQPRIEPLVGHSTHRTTIHHYARHGLCRNFEGQKKLYKALKTKLCNMKQCALFKARAGTCVEPPTFHVSSHNNGEFYRTSDLILIHSYFPLLITSVSFIASFVIDLCRRKDSLLDKWVGELFDIDGDGSVTHHEKLFYEHYK